MILVRNESVSQPAKLTAPLEMRTRSRMKTNRLKGRQSLLLLASGLCSIVMATGCGAGLQTQIAGQTLPSSTYLRDDVQYFPAGPEDRLPNMRAELERYKAEREATENELLGEPAVAP